jgi:predicted metalloprotease with PDZ domain
VEVRELMAHETSHNFIGHTTGDTEAGDQWYSEGADVYYTNVLTYRAGLMSFDRFAENMNTLVAEYFQNPLSHLSNEEVTQQFFASHDAEVVSYQRGPLYFASVDASLRAASGGRRRVDDLVRAMVHAAFDGSGASVERWKALLQESLGTKGVVEFEAMMHGESLNLGPDLFGPCFRRVPTVYRQFRAGFASRKEEKGVPSVGALAADSPAAKAGVRNGDELLEELPKPIDQHLAGRPFTLHLRRDGHPMTVEFDAWGPPVEGWSYVRTDVPERDCHI